MTIFLWLELALFLWNVLDLDLVLVPTDLLALDHLAVVGDAHLTGDLPALGFRMNLLHRLLLQGTLLHRPLLALLVNLNTERAVFFFQYPCILFIIIIPMVITVTAAPLPAEG